MLPTWESIIAQPAVTQCLPAAGKGLNSSETPMNDTRTERRPLILIVDDHPDSRAMYCSFLEIEGFACVQADDGAAALRLASELRPALVIMDIAMPRMDGLEAVEEMKRDPVLRSIPVIVLTALAMD